MRIGDLHRTEEDGTPPGLAPSDPPDPQLRGVLEAMREAGIPPLHVLGVPAARARVLASRDGADPGPRMSATEDIAVPGPGGPVPIRRYRPIEGTSRGVAVYLHGGGWVVGGLDESDGLCRHLAAWSGCDVVSVGYRLAPEHRFPAAVEDADAVTRWLAAGEPAGTPLVVLGDSAGANLATVVARRSRDRGGPPIVLQILVYPVTDHRMATASYREHHRPLLIGGDDMRWFWDLYAPDVRERSGPDASPGLVADLAGLPPAHVIVAEHDPLRDEALAYAARLDAAGVAVTVDRYAAMAHGFFPLVGVVDAATEAVRSVATAIARAVERA